ncbi:MAG TPA: hypothetical protein VHX88_07345 [Solirubrobacteraceae bacterium]|jgi:hypothetical protein|nr:hypothetical protein [Solirubrobacteraceae bacterium]
MRITAGTVHLRVPTPPGWGVSEDLFGARGSLALVDIAGPCYLSISVLYAYEPTESTDALVSSLDPSDWAVTRQGRNALAEIISYPYPGSSGQDALLGDLFLPISRARSVVVQYAAGIWPHLTGSCGSPQIADRAPALRQAIAEAMLGARLAPPRARPPVFGLKPPGIGAPTSITTPDSADLDEPSRATPVTTTPSVTTATPSVVSAPATNKRKQATRHKHAATGTGTGATTTKSHAPSATRKTTTAG